MVFGVTEREIIERSDRDQREIRESRERSERDQREIRERDQSSTRTG